MGINPLDQSQKSPTTPGSSIQDELEATRVQQEIDDSMSASCAAWAEEVAGVNSGAAEPSYTSAVKLFQERVKGAEEHTKVQLLDDVHSICVRAAAAAGKREQLAKLRGKLVKTVCQFAHP